MEALDFGKSGLKTVLLIIRPDLIHHFFGFRNENSTHPLRLILLSANGFGDGIFEGSFVVPQLEFLK